MTQPSNFRSMYWVLIPQPRIDAVHIPNETSPTEVESAGLEDRQPRKSTPTGQAEETTA
jgi:hypothetical protein